MVVVIPAYEPDEKLINLVKNLKKECDCEILIVDDGSGEKYKSIFDKASAMGAKLIKYEKNKGKGFALKTAFNELKTWDDVDKIVTADCDGQHLPKDILKISNLINNNGNKIILGTRHFSGNIPMRSILGNKFTSMVFQIINTEKISDTQTGLRGFSSNMLDYLCKVEGNRYDYEMNMLLECNNNDYSIIEVPIETVYIDNNSSSHFNPIIDSIKIYVPILKFSGSSIISAMIDFILLLMLKYITSNLFISVVFSRIVSSSINYLINKNYVFKTNKSNHEISFHKYYELVAIILIGNYIILNYFCMVGIPFVLSKVLTEIFLFMFSFMAQKKFVFKNIKSN